MRDFVRAIRAALRSLRTWVWRVVDGALQLVQTDSPGGVSEPGYDVRGDQATAEADGRGARLARIRQLAMELVHNLDAPPADLMRGIGPVTAAWLATMSNPMLLRVATANDHELADHLSGKRSIRGVLAHDPGTIEDYRRVLAQPAQSHEYEVDELLTPAT